MSQWICSGRHVARRVDCLRNEVSDVSTSTNIAEEVGEVINREAIDGGVKLFYAFVPQ